MRKFALCSSSLALVFAFMVLTSLSAFADDSIEVSEGYNIDCVPYSSYISSLIVTDNTEEASVYYSSSKARTYSATASTFSVSSTSSSDSSTDYLYSFSDYISLFSLKSLWSPWFDGFGGKFYDLETNSEGYRGVKLLIGSNQSITSHSAVSSLPDLKASNKYSFSFTIVQQALTLGSMSLRIYDSADSTKYIDLYNNTAKPNTGKFLKVNQKVSGNIIIPDNWTGSIKIRFLIENMAGAQPTIYINNFVIRDITNENLDKSLDKFGDRIDGIINPSEPYSQFDDGSFQGSANELKDAENALPSVNHDEFQSLANSIDLSEYSNAFAQINNLFGRVVDTVGITPLIFFALFFGICIFILGRKLSGG